MVLFFVVLRMSSVDFSGRDQKHANGTCLCSKLLFLCQHNQQNKDFDKVPA